MDTYNDAILLYLDKLCIHFYLYKTQETNTQKSVILIRQFRIKSPITSLICNITTCNFHRFLIMKFGSLCVESRKFVSPVFLFDDFHTLYPPPPPKKRQFHKPCQVMVPYGLCNNQSRIFQENNRLLWSCPK